MAVSFKLVANSVNKRNILHDIAVIERNKFHLFLYQWVTSGKMPLDFSVFANICDVIMENKGKF